MLSTQRLKWLAAVPAVAAISIFSSGSALASKVYVKDTTVNEFDGTVLVRIRSDVKESQSIQLRIDTLNGNGNENQAGIEGVDFDTFQKVVKIGPNRTRTSVKIPIFNDSSSEPTEDFRVRIREVISGPAELATDADGLPGTRIGTVTIFDDDIPAGSLEGSLGSGTGTTFNAGGSADPFSLQDFILGSNLDNATDLEGVIDEQGFIVVPAPDHKPLRNHNLVFNPPATWPPASATDATSLPVPGYIERTNYVGALRHKTGRANQWTADWTLKINGNDAVWDFAGGEAGTALEVASSPVADDSCPAGTTLKPTSFVDEFGMLSGDETGLFNGVVGDYDICLLDASILGVVSLSNDNVYELASGFPGTTVGNGNNDRTTTPNPVAAILNIEAGTLIFGEAQEALVVTRNSQINASGTQANPIVMTSRTQLGNRFDGSLATPTDSSRGEWAGLAIMGYGRDAKCASFATCDVAAEGNVGSYGGDNDNDDSGMVNYVIVRQAGNDIDGQGNELNGITMFAVGRQTEMQNIQVHRNLDDGIENFGGSAFFKNVVLTGMGDDSFDWDNGWTGGAQNVLIIQEGDVSNRGVEADGRFDDVPVTFPLIANMTILAPSSRTAQNQIDSEGQGMLLREGIRVQVWNTIISGDFFNGCLDIDNAETFNRASEAGGSPAVAPGPHLRFENSVFDCQATNFVENG